MAIVAAIKSPTVPVAVIKQPLQPTTAAITLKNQAAVSQNYVRNLLDVIEEDPQTGDTLVYNAAIQKYNVQPPDFNNVSLDGGTF